MHWLIDVGVLFVLAHVGLDMLGSGNELAFFGVFTIGTFYILHMVKEVTGFRP